jgi:DnaJ-class molecular chaperone
MRVMNRMKIYHCEPCDGKGTYCEMCKLPLMLQYQHSCVSLKCLKCGGTGHIIIKKKDGE